MTTEPDSQPVLVAEEQFTPGKAITMMGPSHCTAFSAVFEDDGDTGYLYGLDQAKVTQPILDALHIYNVQSVTDRNESSLAQIVWSADGMRVALFINDYPHAAFDFAKRRGYCRTGFPPPSSNYSVEGHEWSDDVLEYFR